MKTHFQNIKAGEKFAYKPEDDVETYWIKISVLGTNVNAVELDTGVNGSFADDTEVISLKDGEDGVYHIVMFSDREALRKLTGLPDDNYDSALWQAGFDLDDWDVGFQSNKPMHYDAIADFDEEEAREYGEPPELRIPNDDAFWLVRRMEDYCVGYSYTEYGGKHYYLVHHA